MIQGNSETLSIEPEKRLSLVYKLNQSIIRYNETETVYTRNHTIYYDILLNSSDMWKVNVNYKVDLFNGFTAESKLYTLSFSYTFDNSSRYISDGTFYDDTYAFILYSKNVSLFQSEKYRIEGLSILDIPPIYNVSLQKIDSKELTLMSNTFNTDIMSGNFSEVYYDSS